MSDRVQLSQNHRITGLQGFELGLSAGGAAVRTRTVTVVSCTVVVFRNTETSPSPILPLSALSGQ